MQPAITTSSQQTTTIAQQSIHVKPKLSKPKLHQQNIRIIVNQAPYAKFHHTSPIVSSQSLQTELQNPEIYLNQLQSSIKIQKLPGTIIIQDDVANKTSLPSTFKTIPLQQDNPISQVSIAKPLPQIPSRLLSSSFTATLPSLLLLSSSSTPSPSVPVVAPSIALGNTESRSRVPTRQTSSNLLWFNDTLPPFGMIF
ncbi:hypothetical protein WUBG_05186 [Wuchereria bancrofti]|nr:hypothetical protein WUBG_05186 [Wuchereria bancrofti]